MLLPELLIESSQAPAPIALCLRTLIIHPEPEKPERGEEVPELRPRKADQLHKLRVLRQTFQLLLFRLKQLDMAKRRKRSYLLLLLRLFSIDIQKFFLQTVPNAH